MTCMSCTRKLIKICPVYVFFLNSFIFYILKIAGMMKLLAMLAAELKYIIHLGPTNIVNCHILSGVYDNPFCN